MDQFVIELMKYGVVGLVAALFFWLYIQEKKDHAKTREALIASLQGRLTDSQRTTENITGPLQLISQGITLLGDKIESSKRR